MQVLTRGQPIKSSPCGSLQFAPPKSIHKLLLMDGVLCAGSQQRPASHLALPCGSTQSPQPATQLASSSMRASTPARPLLPNQTPNSTLPRSSRKLCAPSSRLDPGAIFRLQQSTQPCVICALCNCQKTCCATSIKSSRRLCTLVLTNAQG